MSNQPTALITGANKGIGLSIAKGLGALGYQVWVGSRDAARGRAAVVELEGAGVDARHLLIDVADPGSVEAAAIFLNRQLGSLDVLVNNAGIALGFSNPPSEQPMDELKAVYEVNVFGPIRVTQAFLPLLKNAAGARVVMMSSGLGSLGLVTDPTSIYSTANLLAYNSSKTALNAVSVAFAKELAPFGIKVNAVEPGSVATDLNGNNGPQTPDEGAASAIRLATTGPDGPTGGFFGHHGTQPW
jgi:NAD(P)-dependent dehydrogenase (short-subunit alcohol dehydrogenase family)